jgi:nitrate reductase (cytochrome), electron transfer subunit
MKKSMVLGIALVLGTMVAIPQAYSKGLVSERGARALDEAEATPIARQLIPDRDPIERDYIQQPPLVPHDVAGYQVDMKFNKCLSCHSWANYKEARATKISQTHFKDRDGNDLANVSPRRYFCTQCHVPQADAPPLVENTFQPVRAISGR